MTPKLITPRFQLDYCIMELEDDHKKQRFSQIHLSKCVVSSSFITSNIALGQNEKPNLHLTLTDGSRCPPTAALITVMLQVILIECPI